MIKKESTKEIQMEPRIEILPETKLTGMRLNMSFAANTTKELWQGFMPKVKEVKSKVGPELYSVEIYKDPYFFRDFDPNKAFEKWAAVKVADFESVPPEMESFIIPSGIYAVFLYKGKASEAPKAYQYIFGTWIPNADFSLDDRPHFAVMGERYKNEDPDSEEEIWIPIKKK